MVDLSNNLISINEANNKLKEVAKDSVTMAISGASLVTKDSLTEILNKGVLGTSSNVSKLGHSYSIVSVVANGVNTIMVLKDCQYSLQDYAKAYKFFYNNSMFVTADDVGYRNAASIK